MNKTKYQKEAEVKMMEMDIEEQALKAAASEYEADDAETRLRKYREEAEKIVDKWMGQRNEIVSLYIDACHTRNNLAQDAPESKLAFNLAKQYEDNLGRTHTDLSAAIETLHTYLHPEKTAETPQELAEYVLEEVLRIEGENMREEFFASLRDYGQTRRVCCQRTAYKDNGLLPY